MSHVESYSNERFFLYLFAHALNGTTPQDIPTDCSWEDVYSLVVKNGVQGLIWEAAKELQSVPEDLRSTWERVANSILIRNVQLEAERSEIVKRLSDAGISYLVLKGAALLPLYPNPSMRSMSDNDVLFGFVEQSPSGGYAIRGSSDETRAEALEEAIQIIRNIMLSMGYTEFERSGDICDVTFLKAPYFCYEMHYSLIERHRPYYFYFSNPWKHAVPIEISGSGIGREFRFSNEDQYVYMIVHAYKHENMGGEGIRILGDIAMVLRAAGDDFDLSYVEEELSRMGLQEFERSLRELTLAIMENQDLSESLNCLAMQMVTCGLGSVEHFVKAKIEEEREAGRWGRLGYLRRLCSPDYYCPGELEFLARNKLLRPLFPVGRLVLFLRKAMRMPQYQIRKVLTLLRGK